MSRIQTLLAGAIASFLLATAAQAAQPAAPAVAKAPPVPLLWKVSDADNALYLLGSFHLLKPDDYPLSKDVTDAFADAESLMFELAPEEIGSPTLALAMAQAAARTNGRPLNDDLPEPMARQLDQWANANSAQLQTMGLSPRALQVFEPWFVGLMVSVTEMTKLGLDPKIGLDMHLSAQSGKADKPAVGLEKGVEQIALFDTMSNAEQLQFLDDALSNVGKGIAEAEELHAAWRRGDAETLWNEMAKKMREEYPQLYRKINVARNDAWVPKLEARLKQESTDDAMAVVGALHLLGEDGVVEKLRAKGYKVERICSACNAGTQKPAAAPAPTPAAPEEIDRGH